MGGSRASGRAAHLGARSASSRAPVSSVLVRHASAGDRRDWAGDDRLRPLDARGRRQSAALVELLRPLEPRRIVSSPYVRCVQTVEPLAAALGRPVEQDDRLAEGAGRAALELLRAETVSWAARTATSSRRCSATA
ncbi:MAG: SixA phosphatase family protein [Gaiellaceae bacterium]